VTPDSIEQYLKAGSRVKVRKQPNPWLVSDHTKVLMFDRRTAFRPEMLFDGQCVLGDFVVGERHVLP
jgi:hypothetical protein